MSIKVSSQDTQVEAENKHMPNQPFPKDSFGDVLAANALYSSDFESSHLTGKAAQGLYAKPLTFHRPAALSRALTQIPIDVIANRLQIALCNLTIFR